MPFFNDDPIDPGLSLKGDIGPGLDNDETDRIKVASAIEKRTGAAPYADLGTFGEGLANSFSKNSGKKRDTSLTPGFLGATMAAQVRKGTDPDGVILKNGPTRDALIRKDNLPGSGPTCADNSLAESSIPLKHFGRHSGEQWLGTLYCGNSSLRPISSVWNKGKRLSRPGLSTTANKKRSKSITNAKSKMEAGCTTCETCES